MSEFHAHHFTGLVDVVLGHKAETANLVRHGERRNKQLGWSRRIVRLIATTSARTNAGSAPGTNASTHATAAARPAAVRPVAPRSTADARRRRDRISCLRDLHRLQLGLGLLNLRLRWLHLRRRHDLRLRLRRLDRHLLWNRLRRWGRRWRRCSLHIAHPILSARSAMATAATTGGSGTAGPLRPFDHG